MPFEGSEAIVAQKQTSDRDTRSDTEKNMTFPFITPEESHI